jgi:hypothetical protein
MVQRRVKGWTARFPFPVGAKDCSLFHRVPTGSGASVASYPILVPGAPSPEVMWLGREADHSLQSTTKIKKGGTIPPFPHTSSLRAAQLSTKTSPNFVTNFESCTAKLGRPALLLNHFLPHIKPTVGSWLYSRSIRFETRLEDL